MKHSIFVVVNLLNLSSKTLSDSEQRKQLALLNCQAGRKALDASAFDSAAEYAKQGIQVLSEDGWEVDYDLQLELYTIGAVSAGFIGEVETLEEYCSEVLQRKDIPIEDKFDIYNALVDSRSNRGLEEESMNLLLG